MTKVPLLAKLLAPHWISIGYMLDLDDYGTAVQLIKSSPAKKPGECFNSVMQKWITGNTGVEPKTWQMFIKILEDMELDVSQVKNIIFS